MLPQLGDEEEEHVLLEMMRQAFTLRSTELVIAINKVAPTKFCIVRSSLLVVMWTLMCANAHKSKVDADTALAFLQWFYDTYPDIELLPEAADMVEVACQAGQLAALEWLATKVDLSAILLAMEVFTHETFKLSPLVLGYALNLAKPSVAEIAVPLFEPVVTLLVEPMYASLADGVWPWFLRILDSGVIDFEQRGIACAVCRATKGRNTFTVQRMNCHILCEPYHADESHGEAIAKQIVHRGPHALRVVRLLASVCDVAQWCPLLRVRLQREAWAQRSAWIWACQPRVEKNEVATKRPRIEEVD